MDRIRIGLIGTGMAWEKLHRPAYDRLKDKFEITAICEKNKEKAENVAQTLGIPSENIYGDYNEMLRSASIDAVDIMVPIANNFEIAKAAIHYNTNFICEKPYAESVKKAKQLIALAKHKKCKILVAENFRYSEENIIIKNLLKQNAIGRTMYFIDNHIRDFYSEMTEDSFSAKEWRQHPSFKGGVFLDSAVHYIALYRFLFGNIRDIYATGVLSNDEFCEYNCINSILTFENSVTGHVAYLNNSTESQHPKVGLRIFGSEGEIFLEEKMCGCVNYTLKNGESKQIYYTPDEGYYNEILNFYNALTNDEEIISTPEKEIGDIQTVFDILDSIKTNTRIYATNSFERANQPVV